jgi:putative Mn2+ efflux pump MntP
MNTNIMNTPTFTKSGSDLTKETSRDLTWGKILIIFMGRKMILTTLRAEEESAGTKNSINLYLIIELIGLLSYLMHLPANNNNDVY